MQITAPAARRTAFPAAHVAFAALVLAFPGCGTDDDLGAPCARDPALVAALIDPSRGDDPMETFAIRDVRTECASATCAVFRGQPPMCTRACVDDDECGGGRCVDVEVAGAGREPEDALGVERLCTPRVGG